jgi:hypothetical protein
VFLKDHEVAYGGWLQDWRAQPHVRQRDVRCGNIPCQRIAHAVKRRIAEFEQGANVSKRLPRTEQSRDVQDLIILKDTAARACSSIVCEQFHVASPLPDAPEQSVMIQGWA